MKSRRREYQERYRFEWRSPMREKLLYTVSISEDGYTGDVEQLYPTPDPIEIEQGGRDDDELVALKTSEATLNILCRSANDPYLNLFTTDPLRFAVQISVCRQDGAGEVCVVLWRGYLQAGAYEQPNAKPPYHLTLTAYDGLALLKDMPWVDDLGERYDGVVAVREVVNGILSRIGGGASWRQCAPIAPVAPGASDIATVADTMLAASAIYSACGGGETAPSCYDVLSSILTTLGVQLFQAYGMWVIRPLTAMLSAPSGSIADFLPLYSDTKDGVGLSTAATITLLPPIHKLTFERPEPTTAPATLIASMLDSGRWRKLWNTRVRRVFERDGLLRLSGWEPGTEHNTERKAQFYGVVYTADSRVEGTTSRITLSMRIGNIAAADKTLNVAVFLTRPRDDVFTVFTWLDRPTDGGRRFVDVLGLDIRGLTSEGAWVNVLEGYENPKQTAMRLFFEQCTIPVSLPKAKRSVYFEVASPESYLQHQDVNISMNGIPSGEPWVMNVVLFGAQGEYMPSVEIRNPSITIEPLSEVVPDITDDEAVICDGGIGNMSYEQTYADMWTLPAAGQLFAEPLLDVDGKKPLRGVVTAQSRNLMADHMAEVMRTLRGDVVRQIDGEVYMPKPIDLNTRWRDRDGHAYYTNYIRYIPRRGVYEVQLRELPTARVSLSRPAIRHNGDMSVAVGLDNSVIFANEDSYTIYRLDLTSGVVTKLLQSPTHIAPLDLRAGVRAACATTEAGTIYDLYAWGDDGTLLSHIEDVASLTTYYSGITDIADMAMNALYDGNTHTWILVGMGGTSATHVQILTKDGELVAYTSTTAGGLLNPSYVRLLPNGYAYTATAPNGQKNIVWHNFSKFAPGEVGYIAGAGTYVEWVNEVYVITRDEASNTYRVYTRVDATIGISESPIYTLSAATYKFVAANDALILFQHRTSASAICYDGRTGDVRTITGTMAGPTSKMWLSRNRVCGAYLSGVDRIITYTRI